MANQYSIRWAATWISLLVAALQSSMAQAGDPATQPARSTPASGDDEATLVRQGSDRFLRHDYEGARLALLRAYGLTPRAETVLKLGMAELQTGHPVEAAQHLHEYLRHTEQPVDKLELVRTKWLPRAEAETARLDVFVPAGTEVLVDGALQEPRAFSTLDEVRAGGPSLSVVVVAGEHDVTARRGTMTEVKHVAAAGGEPVELHFQRLPDASPTSPALGRETAQQSESPAPGADARAREKWIAFVTLGSAAVAATGVAVGFSIAFEENASDARMLRQQMGNTANAGCVSPTAPGCARLWEIDNAEERNGALATGFFIAGGAAAAVAVASLVLWPRHHESALRPSPVVGPRTAGLALEGAW